MEGELQKPKGVSPTISLLLELSATDDLSAFMSEVDKNGHRIDEAGWWYGRRLGSNKMGFEERTPLMIAAMFGSKQVLNYILETGLVDVNRASQSDGATALNCAVAGGSSCAPEVIKKLLDASADAKSVIGKLADLGGFALDSVLSLRRKKADVVQKDSCIDDESCASSDKKVTQTEDQKQENLMLQGARDGAEKKEYPIDLSLPDIKNGIYGTDEFRMYTFKVKPCSRAYSHDWTECPFAHPGENARRRDPRKYHYSCVPCPEHRKGSCRQGDACEYAHGIFECWLHPAQYRTRLCKDEIGCNRRVCFFAHKPEELRPVCSSTGSALLSPRSFSANSSLLDMESLTPLALGSPSALTPTASTAAMTSPRVSSPMGGAMWQSPPNIAPPCLQLPGSRLKAAIRARDMNSDYEVLGMESHRHRQHLLDEMSGLSSPSSWNNSMLAAGAFATSSGDRMGELRRLGGVNPAKIDDMIGCLDPAILPQYRGIPLDDAAPQLQSPTGINMRQNMSQQLRSSYPMSFSSSPICSSSPPGIDASRVATEAILKSRSSAFAKRSQSFIERSAVNLHSGPSAAAASATAVPCSLAGWGSPDGKLEWGMGGEELNKLKKSASFGFRTTGGSSSKAGISMPTTKAPDFSWVDRSLAEDAPCVKPGQLDPEEEQQNRTSNGGSEMLPPWLEQLYMEQEQMVA